MLTIETLLTRFKALDTNKVSSEAVSETSPERVTLNIEQMDSGFRSDGSEILPSYSPLTIQIKHLLGQETRWVNLRNKGDFHAGTFSRVEGLSIITESSDWKNEKLKKKYETSKGKLFGLGKEFKEEYLDKDLRPVFKEKIEALTSLKLK